MSNYTTLVNSLQKSVSIRQTVNSIIDALKALDVSALDFGGLQSLVSNMMESFFWEASGDPVTIFSNADGTFEWYTDEVLSDGDAVVFTNTTLNNVSTDRVYYITNHSGLPGGLQSFELSPEPGGTSVVTDDSQDGQMNKGYKAVPRDWKPFIRQVVYDSDFLMTLSEDDLGAFVYFSGDGGLLVPSDIGTLGDYVIIYGANGTDLDVQGIGDISMANGDILWIVKGTSGWVPLANTVPLNSLISHASNTGNPHGVSKSQVGLGNVDNTSDANKPVSTATQAALDLKANQSTVSEMQSDLDDHIAGSNPHSITKSTVGLSNVDNTSDANKPVSTATQTALDLKASKALTINLVLASSYETVLADGNADRLTVIEAGVTASAAIPPNAEVAYPIGAQINVAAAADTVNVGGKDTNVIVNGVAGGSVSIDPWNGATFVQYKTNEWIAFS